MTLIFALLAALWLSGCGGARYAAPVSDASRSSSHRPTPAKSYPPAPPGQYRVLPGDTLYQIAFDHGLDYKDLAAWNKLVDPDHIAAGSALRLTPPKAPVRLTALPSNPSAEPRPLPAEPTVASMVSEDAPVLWSWPSRGQILTSFGEGLNKGIDIAGRKGQQVQAAAAGRVVYAGSGLRGYGKLIIIRHNKHLLSAYAHNARILVVEGQNVARGQGIGEMGDTDADRTKLHFEIREHGKPVDPMNYLTTAG